MPSTDPGPSWPTVIVTRPRGTAAGWLDALRQQGLPAVALPLLDIGPPDDPAVAADAAQALKDLMRVRPWAEVTMGAHSVVAQPALVMFVSPTAVQSFLAGSADGADDGALAAPVPLSWPEGVWAGATGPGTVQALLAAGVPERAIVSPPEAAGRFDSEALWAELAPRRDWRDQRVWIVRGEGGRNWLSDELAAVGAHVRHVTAYRRAAPRWDAAERAVLDRALAEPQRHVWLFSSSEAVGHWPQGLNAGAHRAVATHARIAEAARRQGMDQVRLAPPQVSAIADAVRAFGQLPAGDPPSPTAPAPRSADGS